MSCSVRDQIMPKGKGVRVNGVEIPRTDIAREVQHHPAKTTAAAWTAAAQALVIRELLLQEARRLAISGQPLADDDGRCETEEEAAIRTLVEREVATPQPDAATCRHYYDNNRDRFRSADIFEAAHILVAADARDADGYARARAEASALAAELVQAPQQFTALARVHSACPSAAQDGNLGQINAGATTPEFEAALRQLAPSAITPEPVATRYGFHLIRLDRRIDGRLLPFELVADRIAAYLQERVERTALAQYVARLGARATIEGVTLADPEALRVH